LATGLHPDLLDGLHPDAPPGPLASKRVYFWEGREGKGRGKGGRGWPLTQIPGSAPGFNYIAV